MKWPSAQIAEQVEVLLGRRGRRDNHAVRFKDIAEVLATPQGSTALRQTLEDTVRESGGLGDIDEQLVRMRAATAEAARRAQAADKNAREGREALDELTEGFEGKLAAAFESEAEQREYEVNRIEATFGGRRLPLKGDFEIGDRAGWNEALAEVVVAPANHPLDRARALRLADAQNGHESIRVKIYDGRVRVTGYVHSPGPLSLRIRLYLPDGTWDDVIEQITGGHTGWRKFDVRFDIPEGDYSHWRPIFMAESDPAHVTDLEFVDESGAKLAEAYAERQIVALSEPGGAIAGIRDEVEASIARLSDEVPGYQIIFQNDVDAAGAIIPGTALSKITGTDHVSVKEAPGELGQNRTVLLEQTSGSERTSGTTNGAYVEIPQNRALTFSARRVRISVLARRSGSSPAAGVGLAYSTSDIGNSGLLGPSPLSDQWEWHHFYYDVPAAEAGGSDFIGLYPAHNDAGAAGVARIVVQIATEAADLPDIANLQAKVDQVLGADVDALEGTALATLLNNLKVGANGESAFVEEQQTATANLKEGLSSGAMIRVGAGDEVSLLDLIAADGSDTSYSIIKMQAEDILIRGSVAADMLTVGYGRNLFPDPYFRKGVRHVGSYQDGSQTSLRIREPGRSYTDGARRTLAIFQNGTRDEFLRADFNDRDESGSRRRFSCSPGDFIEWSARCSAHRCGGLIELRFFDANDEIITSPTEPIYWDTGASNDINTWQRPYIIRKVPSNAVALEPMIRKTRTISGGNSLLIIARPMLAVTHSNAKGPSPFAPEGTTLIDGGDIYTETVTAEALNTDSMRTAGLAVFGGVMRSRSFRRNRSGWRIDQEGNAEFNGALLQRDLLVASGRHRIIQSYNGGYDSDERKIYTGFPSDNWGGLRETYVGLCAMSGTAEYRGGTYDSAYWEIGCDLLAARTNVHGRNPEAIIRARLECRHLTRFDGFIHWSIYRVT